MRKLLMQVEPSFIRLVWGTALFCIAVILAILGLMITFVWPLLTSETLVNLLTGPWAPLKHSYGIRVMIAGTFYISTLALIISFPVSLGVSYFICLTHPTGAGRYLKKVVELMTAIPTVIYGFVGIFLLIPLVREIFMKGSGMSILSAGIMLAILISPTMILFFNQSIEQVPKSFTDAVDALGGNAAQKFFFVLVPQARTGLISGLILAFGRAVGDTLIALMISGNSVAKPSTLLDSARTLTAHIALVIAADFDSFEFKSLFACGICLYIISTAGIAIAYKLRAKRALKP